MNQNSENKKIGILDWMIFFSIIILIIMVYVPPKVWAEESKYRQERRNRMKHIALAEDFYYELTGEYTTDINELFALVESSMDSLIADSTFTGTQNININLYQIGMKNEDNPELIDTLWMNLNKADRKQIKKDTNYIVTYKTSNKSYKINIDASFAERVDTSYSIPEKIKTKLEVTVHQVSLKNEINSTNIDTLWINDDNYKNIKTSSEFIAKYDTKIDTITSVQTDYLRRKFHLNMNEFIFCPISKNNIKKKKFILNIDKSNPKTPIFSIVSPLDKNDNELRYGIFRFKPGKKESIVGGVQSWAGN